MLLFLRDPSYHKSVVVDINLFKQINSYKNHTFLFGWYSLLKGKLWKVKSERATHFNFPTAFATIDVFASECFTSIEAQLLGSVHDSGVLENSSVHEEMNGVSANAVFLGIKGC